VEARKGGRKMKIRCSKCDRELKVTVTSEDKEEVWVMPCSRCSQREFYEGKTTGGWDPHGVHEMGH